MDVLTLPEEGWALAYPSPRHDVAHLLHTPCGWRSAPTQTPDSWRYLLMQDRHECFPAPPTKQRWCGRCSKPFAVAPGTAPHILCATCSATNPDKRVRDRFRALLGRRP